MASVSSSSTAPAVAAALQAAGRAVEDLETANDAAGRVVLAATRPPRGRGTLAAGMFARADGQGVEVASTARHWSFVHWGAPRANVRAQPFVLAAVRATRQEVADLYLEHLRTTVRNIN